MLPGYNYWYNIIIILPTKCYILLIFGFGITAILRQREHGERPGLWKWNFSIGVSPSTRRIPKLFISLRHPGGIADDRRAWIEIRIFLSLSLLTIWINEWITIKVNERFWTIYSKRTQVHVSLVKINYACSAYYCCPKWLNFHNLILEFAKMTS